MPHEQEKKDLLYQQKFICDQAGFKTSYEGITVKNQGEKIKEYYFSSSLSNS